MSVTPQFCLCHLGNSPRSEIQNFIGLKKEKEDFSQFLQPGRYWE